MNITSKIHFGDRLKHVFCVFFSHIALDAIRILYYNEQFLYPWVFCVLVESTFRFYKEGSSIDFRFGAVPPKGEGEPHNNQYIHCN